MPFATPDIDGSGGNIRVEPEDFSVVELPLYEPNGSGSHLFLNVRKKGLTTQDLVKALVRGGVCEREIGVAGLKDKRAITEQWLSIPNRKSRALCALADVPGVEVLATSRHKNKLAMGHLSGNQFKIRIRDISLPVKFSSTAIVKAINNRGFPNYFGPQRFGRYGRNAVDGLRLVRGERVPGDRRLKRFFLGALQSMHFNRVLARRINQGLFDQVVVGDWARKHDTGGTFLVDDPGEGDRAKRLEISATLPLYGRKVRISDGIAGVLEQQALQEMGVSWVDFSSRRGDRRFSRVVPSDFSIERYGTNLLVQFRLRKGSYATSLLREITKTPIDEQK